MTIIQDFLGRYQREYDYYQETARLCALQCETELERNGIRSIVTFRAKRPDRLIDKAEKRNGQRSYEHVDDIYRDIADLAGVRVALYFPGDKTEVDRIIRSLFTVAKLKIFPSDSGSQTPSSTYSRRFAGYTASHYHVRLREENLPEADKRYAEAIIEIQVASVLMHAWAEVEHDLAYKPLSGDISEDEYAILDALNGLVLSGEISLERLQKAVHQRASKRGKSFSNHYELAAYLYDAIRSMPESRPSEPVMGRADVLLRFLQLANLDRPDVLEEFVSTLDSSGENRPIAEQLADRILLSNVDLYQIYEQARREVGSRNPYWAEYTEQAYGSREQALGYFLVRWIAFETALGDATTVIDPETRQFRGNVILTSRVLEKVGFPVSNLYEIESIKTLRNQVVHGVQRPGSAPLQEEQLVEAGHHLENILIQWRSKANGEIRKVVDEALRRIKHQSDADNTRES